MQANLMPVDEFLKEAQTSPVTAVEKAIAHPQVINFAPLLQVPQIQQLQNTNPLVYKTLLLFAYGTMEDDSKEVPLDESALNKLRALSLISYASKERWLKYDQLMPRLRLTTVRQVEDLIIENIYKGFISGKMDSMRNLVEIYDFASRDVRSEETNSIAKTVDEWLQNANSTAKSFNNVADEHDTEFKDCRRKEREMEAMILSAKKNLENVVRNEQMDLPMMHGLSGPMFYNTAHMGGHHHGGGPQQRRKGRGGGGGGWVQKPSNPRGQVPF